MMSLTRQRWGRRSASALASHLKCITTVDEACRRDLESLSEGTSFFISFSDRKEKVTLAVVQKGLHRRVLVSVSREAEEGIILPPVYRSSGLSLEELYAQNYITLTGDTPALRHVMLWMHRSEAFRRFSRKQGRESAARAARYWVYYLLRLGSITGGRSR